MSITDLIASITLVILAICLLPIIITLGLFVTVFFLALCTIMIVFVGVIYGISLIVGVVIEVARWFKRTAMPRQS